MKNQRIEWLRRNSDAPDYRLDMSCIDNEGHRHIIKSIPSHLLWDYFDGQTLKKLYETRVALEGIELSGKDITELLNRVIATNY